MTRGEMRACRISLPFVGLWLAAMVFVGSSARGDRSVLGPTGDTLAPDSYRSEFALDPLSKSQNRIWLQFSTPQGIELETERLDLTGERRKGYALNIQYPITYSLVASLPAVAVGIRDCMGTGNEHGAFYLAATKTIRLSDRQHRFAKEFKIDVGVGTGRIGGLFVGAKARLASGLLLQAELYQRRPNITVGLPITRHLDARAYSLDSHFYYGLSFSVQR